jgi:hypothetical protein
MGVARFPYTSADFGKGSKRNALAKCRGHMTVGKTAPTSESQLLGWGNVRTIEPLGASALPALLTEVQEPERSRKIVAGLQVYWSAL